LRRYDMLFLPNPVPPIFTWAVFLYMNTLQGQKIFP